MIICVDILNWHRGPNTTCRKYRGRRAGGAVTVAWAWAGVGVGGGGAARGVRPELGAYCPRRSCRDNRPAPGKRLENCPLCERPGEITGCRGGIERCVLAGGHGTTPDDYTGCCRAQLLHWPAAGDNPPEAEGSPTAGLASSVHIVTRSSATRPTFANDEYTSVWF